MIQSSQNKLNILIKSTNKKADDLVGYEQARKGPGLFYNRLPGEDIGGKSQPLRMHLHCPLSPRLILRLSFFIIL